MHNGQFVDTSTKQNLQLKVDPRVVLTGQLLELNAVELKHAIRSELNENPALEWLDDGLDELTQDAILHEVAPQEKAPSSEDREFQRSRPNDAEESDWLDFAASFDSLESHLVAQMSTRIEPAEAAMAEVLIYSLDDRGYLATPIEEVALDHQFDLDKLMVVHDKLKTCEPAGIGAENVQECLRLQLRFAETEESQLAHDIVAEAFDDLVQRNVRGIMRKFRVIPELIQAAFDEIMQLNPFPADSFQRQQPGASVASRRPSVAIDLVIQRSEMGWTIELPGIKAEDLIVARSYREFTRQEVRQMESAEKRHLQEYTQRAKNFIEAIRQRGATLRRIGHYLIEHQSSYISTGDLGFLKSGTRRQLAADLGLHESTISRATAGKHVQLPTGEVVGFDVFFKPAVRIQQMIMDIVQNEKPGETLSDEKIAQILADRGIHIARRTVNKYRDRTKTLSSRKRTSA